MSYTNFSIAVLMGEIDKKPEERSFTTNNRRSMKIKDNKLALHTEGKGKFPYVDNRHKGKIIVLLPRFYSVNSAVYVYIANCTAALT